MCGEPGAPCKEVYRSFVSSVTGAARRWVVSKAMIKSVVPKVTTVNSDFGEQSDAVFVNNTIVPSLGRDIVFPVGRLKG